MVARLEGYRQHKSEAFYEEPPPRRSGPSKRDWLTSFLSGLAVIIGTIAPFSRVHLWLEAIIDRRSGTQIEQDDFTPFIREMSEDFNKRAAEAASRFLKIEAYLKARKETLQRQLTARTIQFSSEVKPTYDEAAKRMRDANDACQNHQHKSLAVYLIMLWVFAVSDFPTQIAAFDALLDAGWQVWTICAGVAVLTGAIAHFVGNALNQKGLLWRGTATFSCLMMVALFALIAFLRETSFEQLSLQFGVKLAPRLAALVYFTINVCILTAASVYSFLVHRPAEEECRRKKKAAARGFAPASRQYEELCNFLSSIEESLTQVNKKLEVLPQDAEAVRDGLQAIFRKKHQIYLKTFFRTRR